MTAQQFSNQDANWQSPAIAPTWCPVCREEVGMILAEKAAVVCQCSRRRIYRWVEDGDLHYTETLDGEVLVCGRSLSRKMDELDCSTNRLYRRSV